MPNLDLTTLSAEDEGDGVRVKLSFFVRGAYGLLDAISAVQDRINHSTGTTTHAPAPAAPASADTSDAGDTDAQPGGDVESGKPARRSRRAAGEAKAEAPVDGETGGVGSRDLNADAPAPAPSRRRRATAAADAPAADVAPEAEAAPAPRRRRVSTGGVSNDKGTDRAPADAPRDRGAGRADDAPKLTLVDLGKAASAAAEKITPAGVTEVLGAFNVDKINKLPKEHWQDFVDVLVDRMEQADLEAS